MLSVEMLSKFVQCIYYKGAHNSKGCHCPLPFCPPCFCPLHTGSFIENRFGSAEVER